MKPSLWLACCVLAGSALGPATWAQPSLAAPQAAPPATAPATPPATPPAAPAGSEAITPLAAAFESAWQRAVLARETDGQRLRAVAEKSAAGSLWAAPPALELSHRNDRFNSAAGSRETEVGFAWPLWLPGQRAARGAAAHAGVALADTALRAARLRVAGEVREAAWALLSQRADLAQADALVQSLVALSDDVQRRVNAGDLARADALAASAEGWAATAQQTEARQRLLSAQTRWQVLTGIAALPDATEGTPPGSTPEHPEL
ncbi:MAG TPA: TolC family protein [Variovorax sp.]|nr:TolC family protein [Variovorax sp.]